jgi:hypothetical protein
MRSRQKRHSILLAAVLAGTIVAAGCGSDDDKKTAPKKEPAAQTGQATAAQGAKDTTYVGKVEGTDAYIGIVAGTDGAFAYVCDGEKISQWLRGGLSGSELGLVAGTGGAVTAALTGDTLKGTVLLPDPTVADPQGNLASVQSYTFEAVKAEGDAGLFREERDVEGKKYAAGWVRLNDKSVRGNVGIAGDPTDPVTGDIAPPNLLAIFGAQPLTFHAVTKVPKPTRACSTASSQYNLAEKEWDEAQPPPNDGDGPVSGTEFFNFFTAIQNFKKLCGVNPPFTDNAASV